MIKTITSNSVFKSLMLGGTLMFSASLVKAQISLPALNLPYTQDFNTLQMTGTGFPMTIPDWSIFEQGTSAAVNQLYITGTGSSGTGDTYSYGSASNPERALGSISSGTFISTFGAFFVNNTGAMVNTLAISYRGEQWRSGDATNPADSLVFQYSMDATDLTTASGNWIFVPSLNFKAPINNLATTPLDGNAAGNFTVITNVISGLNIPNGATFRIRWTDPNTIGTDDGLAIDDFSLTPMFINTLSINDVSMNEGNAGTTSFDFTVSLTAPAGMGGVSFDIGTADFTAVSPIDYIGVPVTTQTIPQGNSSYTFSVLVNGDLTLEPTDTFYVNVTNAPTVVIGDGLGLGIIVNDEYVAPVINTEPVDLEVCSGSIAMFTAAASGEPAPAAQWQVSTNGGNTWTNIAGETSDMLSFTATSADSSKMYRVYYTNVAGADTSFEATLLVNPTFNLTENVGVCEGGNYTYPDGTVHTNIVANESYISSFTTVLGCDSIITTNVTVNPYSQITANSGNVRACGDVSADFGIVSSGTNDTYQWYYDFVPSPGFPFQIDGSDTEINFDTDTMTIQQLITGNYNDYYVYCEVTNEFGCITKSENDTIVVNDLPIVTASISATTVCAGTEITLTGGGATTYTWSDGATDGVAFPATGTHTYTVTGTDNNLCQNTATVDITVNALPTAAYMSAVNIDVVDFMDMSTDAVSFAWDFGDGTFSTIQSPSHTYADNGTYTVCLMVTSAQGCSDSVCSPITIQEISLKELGSNASVSLYPNPAKDKLTLTFTSEVKAGSIKMINAIGQVVKSEVVNSGAKKFEMNLTNIKSGVYYLVIVNGTESTVKKVIVD